MKGQISTYILIGILIVGIYGIYNLIGHVELDKEAILDFDSVENFVQQCLDNSAQKVVDDIGYHAGIVNYSEFVITDTFETPLLVYGLDKRKITKDEVYENIKNNLNNELSKCFDFSYFKEKGFIFQDFDYSLNVNNNIITLDYPLKVTYAERTKAYTTFITKYNVDFEELILITNSIIDSANANEVPLETILDLKELYDVNIDTYTYDVYNIFLLNKNNYNFVFATGDSK